jgi:DNA-binding NtrC family response regulator
MFTRSPLKILLADPDYNQYLLLKRILQAKCKHYCNLFWCGDRISYNHALRSGIYDLAMIDAGKENLEALRVDKSSEHHTPVVLMMDSATRDDAMTACQLGVLGILDKHHLDDASLACYLVCAELFHKGELEEGFVANIMMLGKHKQLQRPYTYIH